MLQEHESGCKAIEPYYCEIIAIHDDTVLVCVCVRYRLNEAPEEGKGTATVTFDSTPAESPCECAHVQM